MNVTAIIKPHIGIQDTEAGRVQYRHPTQDMVFFTSDEMVGEKFVGYIRREKGGAFLPTTPFVEQPKGLQDLIHEAVNKAAGDPRPLGILPLHPNVLEEFEEAESDEDEPEEDE